MRWDIIKKAWKLARDNFPDAKNLFVEIPRRFRARGAIRVYDLAQSQEPIGELSYEGMAVNGQPFMVLTDKDESMTIRAVRVSQSLRTSSSVRPMGKAAAVDSLMLKRRYPDGFERGQALALLFSSQHDNGKVSPSDLGQWLSRHGVESNMFVPMRAGLETLGVRLCEDLVDSYNFRLAKKPRKFQEYDRVRVMHPTSMEYQECGRVLEYKGTPKHGFWYLVLVDGSDRPLWFPEESLEKDAAGEIVDPVPESINE